MKPLWGHQKKAIDLARDRDNFALFFEMGCGKTRSAIEIALEKYRKHGEVLPTLILSPLVVCENWRREFLEYSEIPSERIVILTGTQSKRMGKLRQVVERFGSEFVMVMNYEGLLIRPLYDEIVGVAPQLLICDESHRLKTHNTKRTRLAVALARSAKYRFLLSGTPVLNSPMDLFSQYLVMDGGESFSKNFYIFRAKYFYDANQYMPSQVKFPNWKPKENSISEINEVVHRTSMRVTKDECLDLPPLTREKRYCDMTVDQFRMYKQMERDFITYMHGQACVAQLALTKALRLQQIVSGFVKLEGGEEISLPATPREQALEELLEELTPNHKVIVWAVFQHNYAQIRKICEKLKIQHVEVHGGISDREKQAGIEAFNTDPNVRVYLGHSGSGGIGVNLTVSDYAIYFSRDFSLEHDLQSEARNHRGGSERFQRITRIDLVTPNTIDEIVLEKLAKKEALGESLLSSLRGVMA